MGPRSTLNRPCPHAAAGLQTMNGLASRVLVSFLLLSSASNLVRSEATEIDSSDWEVQDILLKFYEQTGGLGWTSSDGWLTEDVCTYQGVICYGDDEDDFRRAGHVKEISLPKMGLSGTVPEHIYKLPYLTKLDLRQNDDLVVAFDGIEDAKFLESLDFSQTHTTSLTSLGRASHSLKELHMSDLEMDGPIPAAIFKLTALTSLIANNNGFSGSISADIGDLFYLEELSLKDNDLRSFIPTHVGNLVNLQTLNLANNPFRGDIPSGDIDKLVELRTLDLSCDTATDGKGLTGLLPSLSNHPNIIKVDLSNHKISGSIPINFLAKAPTDKPVTVDLSDNLISGSVPSSLSKKKRLDLYLADNRIVQIDSTICSNVPGWLGGDVTESNSCNGFLCPPAFFSSTEGRATKGQPCQACSSSQYFGATQCGTTSSGDINERGILVEFFDSMGGPRWKSSEKWMTFQDDYCTWKGITCASNSITAIRLPNNDMSGTPPKSLFDLPNLSVLDLSYNSIDFKFDGIQNAKSLEVLDLTQTDMSDLTGVGQLASTSIRVLSLASNDVAGNVPNSLFSLASLEELDLSHNRFDGNLSDRIGQLNSLQRLYIFGNRFSGQFPETIGNLVDLQELKASENNFEGNLPSTLNNLVALQHLSIRQVTSSTGIGGSLPSLDKLSKLTTVYLDGNALAGDLPPGFLAGTIRGSERMEFSLSDNRFTGSVPSAWATRFRKLNLDLTGNLLTSFGDGVCDQDEWMDGLVESYGCDAILCDVRKYNEIGRQTGPSSTCRDCDKVNVLGAKYCGTAPITAKGNAIDILTEFYHATQGDDWTTKTGWTTEADHCSWHGITCGPSGHVKVISLENNGLTGTPPRSLFELEGLTELDLRRNEISFMFDGIANAKSLAALDLSSTHLNSVSGIQGASGLASLRLDDNDLKGPFPSEILQLESLRLLSVNSNQIEGGVPNGISNLVFLTELFLVDNRLDGQLPAQIGELSRLKMADLSGNNFDGTIPESFNNLIAIETLAIQRGGGFQGPDGASTHGVGRGIYGALPAFDKLENLRELRLAENSLSGPIPLNFLGGIEDKNVPIDVDLSQNRLSGGLPPSLARFESMTLDVSGNRLTEEIPPGICRQAGWMKGKAAVYGCEAIMCPPGTANQLGRRPNFGTPCDDCESGTTTEYFGSYECVSPDAQRERHERHVLEEFFAELDGNRWVNHDNWLDPKISICKWHGIDCSSEGETVESIHLVQNGLMGEVPGSVFRLANLVELDLSYNGISVEFSGIESASNLQFLNLDHTGLRSVSGIERAPSLMLLHLIANDFDGTFPPELMNLQSLEVLYFSENDVGGSLPAGLSSLGNIAGFACKACGLVGQIPAFIGTWQSLEFLDLADNHMTGEVPITVASLPSLKFIDLSHQMTENSPGLSGSLPLFDQSKTLVEVHLQRNSFTGPLPDDFMNLVEFDNSNSDLYIVDISFNNFTGVVPSTWSRLSFASLYLAGNELTGFSNGICALAWNNNQGSPTCDYLACGKGFYNGVGRATASLPCEVCDSANFIGSTFCVEGERERLMSLYTKLGGKLWKHDDGWGSESSICTWYGVTCHEGVIRPGSVNILDLSNNGLQGTLPPDIWLLTEMTELDLSGNKITIESFLKAEDASSLQSLKLSQNEVLSLDGIGNVASIKYLHCTNCQIQGGFPMELLNLQAMESLVLNYNEMTGRLPTNINQMFHLKELQLVHNQFNDTLPYQIGYLFFLEKLSMGSNKFVGPIPTQLGALPFLKSLALDNPKPEQQEEFFSVLDSNFIGDLPSFSRAKNLRELYLSYNSIGGSIPADFLSGVNDKQATVTVELTGNVLRSTIPAELAAFEDLRLYVAGNHIQGIAPEVCNKYGGGGACDELLCPPGTWNEVGRRTLYEECHECNHRGMGLYYGSTMCDAIFPEFRSDRSMLEDLYQHAGGDDWVDKTNWLREDISICEWFGITCDPTAQEEKVAEIALPGNNLKGMLASISFYLPSLRKIDLSGNDVSVSFKDIKDAQVLEEVDLRNSGVVNLEGIGQATHLKILRLSDNVFHGQSFPDEIYDLTELRVLDIARTGFSGEVSSQLHRLSNLETLLAAGNELVGTLPDSAFGTLQNLQTLDLSNNLFYGPLPGSLQSLSSLNALQLGARDVPQAGLSGPLLSFAEYSSLSILDLGGNTLTGTIPEDFLSGITDKAAQLTVLLDSNVIHGTVPAILGTFGSLNISLADNEIESIDPSLCDTASDCDTVLCSAGTYNRYGRQTSPDDQCKNCPGDISGFLGQTQCLSISKAETKKILEELYHQTGGNNWKNKEGWFTNPDICNWSGVTCKNKAFVETINLGSNNLVNTPPKEIFNIEGLKNLWLFSNPISFSFSGIENARTLENLQLDSTHIDSLEGVGEAPALRYLDVRFNGMATTLPEEIENLRYLETLLLSENKLYGTLPNFLGNRRLSILRASGNAFVGTLPSFASHPLMKTLDVSQNELYGDLPTDLFAQVATSEAVLVDLSGNKFSGSIPGALSRFADLTIYARDNQFSGIDPELCSKSEWNGGSVGVYGCDAILCPPQTFSAAGRASVEIGDCQRCEGAQFFGHTECGGGSISSANGFTRTSLAMLLLSFVSSSLLLLTSC